MFHASLSTSQSFFLSQHIQDLQQPRFGCSAPLQYLRLKDPEQDLLHHEFVSLIYRSSSRTNTGTNLDYDPYDQFEKVMTWKRIFERTYKNLNSTIRNSFLVLVPETGLRSKHTIGYKPPDKSTL